MAIMPLIFLSLFTLATLSSEFDYKHSGSDWPEECKGNKQSPVDLKYTEERHCQNPITLDFPPLSQYYVNPGHWKQYPNDRTSRTLFVDLDQGIGRQVYHFNDMHFHAPSEHFIGGTQYDLELHMVHVSSVYSQKYAVLCVYFQAQHGAPTNQFLFSIQNARTINFGDLFEGKYLTKTEDIKDNQKRIDTSSFLFYQGSLTTPPCTQSVNFIAFNQIIPIPQNQLDFFTHMWRDNSHFADGHGNNRQLQEIRNRTIIYYHPSQVEDQAHKNS